MSSTEISQSDFFLAPPFDTKTPLLPPHGVELTILIGCGRRKKRSSAPAAELYASPRFNKAKAIAEKLGANYYILSGKHGLVNPEKPLAPYDFDLRKLSPNDRATWGVKLAKRLAEIKGQICILSTPEYSDPIMTRLNKRRRNEAVFAPIADIDELYQEAWYDQALAFCQRVKALEKFYGLVECHRQLGKVFLLGDLGAQKLPRRGVYVFLDRNEKNFLASGSRIVRVGTHAISAGSKAVLKSRLRNHLGLKNGSGNHRGSIFRLHIGRAFLEREEAFDMLPSWGSGQDAPPEVRTTEASLEIRVSEYLRKLEVFILDVDDEPSKNSLRVAVERQLITLCSEGLITIDSPSDQWLGLSSTMHLIVKSGLWNLRDVGKPYDPGGRGSVDEICSWRT